jgi:hypothetical protein
VRMVQQMTLQRLDQDSFTALPLPVAPSVPVVSMFGTTITSESFCTAPGVQMLSLDRVWNSRPQASTVAPQISLTVIDPLPDMSQVKDLDLMLGIHMMNSTVTGDSASLPSVRSPSARVESLALSPPLQTSPEHRFCFMTRRGCPRKGWYLF